MTYEEIEVSSPSCETVVLGLGAYVHQEKYPEDAESRDEDKFNYRYRGGESYRDVVVRLEPVIMELERQRDILIIGHQVSCALLVANSQLTCRPFYDVCTPTSLHSLRRSSHTSV